MLREHRKRQREERLVAGPAWDASNDLGVSRRDRQADPSRLVHASNSARIVAASGSPPIRLHDLRHTYATLALKAGVHPKVVSERLGHATVGITLDLYSHVTPAIARDAADVVAKWIF